MTRLTTETLIIGAGPSGLAVAACLKRLGRPYVLLERADSLASTWRRHYERLHLHTAKQYSHLPYHPMPEDYPTYPSRTQVVAYLEDYARSLELDVRTGVEVTAARHHSPPAPGWQVDALDHGHPVTWYARHLVVATGYNATPVLPDWPGLDTFAGPVLHSSAYTNGARFRGHDVLVVGSGNSGAEITIDLWEHGARPAMLVRGPVHVVPRDVFGLPAQTLAIALSHLPPRLADRLSLPMRDLVIGDLSAYGFRRPALGPVELLEREGRVPLIDIGTLALVKQGAVTVYPDISKIETSPTSPTSNGDQAIPSQPVSTLHFADGRSRRFDAIVLATGYRTNLPAWLHTDALDDRGLPKTHGHDAGHGLFFLGFRNPSTGNLREISLEAQRIARHIRLAH